ncbi:hypothetical protein AAFN85_15680 [Mucilaginibacter sp. CAU 1740]|uniref:hypothetical protein n=1 Tax=Mucilaginibacter sp. CAU 1740 TaxID=3140365 RepID=UPI00325B6C98
MKRIYFLLIIIASLNTTIKAQINIPTYLRVDTPDSSKTLLLASLDTLFKTISTGKTPTNITTGKNAKLTASILGSFKGLEVNEKTKQADFYKKQLINCYSLDSNNFALSMAYIALQQDSLPKLKNIIALNAHIENKHVTYSLPLQYLTTNWTLKKVGGITYHYTGKFSASVAAGFNRTNSEIAKKLSLPTEQFDFYLCDNYQQILTLLGYTYDVDSNGRTRDGYGVDANTIFSIMHSEDFSHDLVHYYISKIRTAPRNTFAEEGLAYYWGNAYYTNNEGLMITQQTLVKALRKYLLEHPEVTLLSLFKNNPKVFNEYARELSVRSVIAGIICAKVEKEKGVAGIKELVNCGRGDDNFYKAINKLVNITETNFDEVLRQQAFGN